MSERKNTPPLDALLAAWPTRERSALDWDDSADRVISRLSAGVATGVSDEDLLRPPLPATAAEVQSSAPIAPHRASEGTGMSTASRQRDRASFKDLAKMANAPPSAPASSGVIFGTAVGGPQGEEKKDKEENSGVINLAQLAAGEQPAASAAPASAPLPPIPRDHMSTLRSAAPPPPGLEKAVASARTAKAAGEKRGGAWIVVSSMVAAAAVAAGVFFGLQKTQRADAVAMAPAANAPASPAAAPKPAQAAATQAVTTPIPPEERGVDPSSLPPAQAVGAQQGAVAGRAPLPSVAKPPQAGAGGAAAPTPEPQAVAAATATAPPPAASASPAPAGSQSLQDLMQQAAGVTSSPTATAAATSTDAPLPAPGSVPLKPSQGAIQGALGAAMPGARACLGPDDPISHATVTFKSDGSVQSVSISGGAAGKPAEACIRGALSRARVQPFAQPTFTVPATVRPN